jgi:carbamoyl-phosphate synthase small subunit
MINLAKQRAFLFVARSGARGLASHAPAATPAVLHLKTGQSFNGKAFGSQKSIFGETVFSTSITSCMYIRLIQSPTLTISWPQTLNQ